MYCPIISHFFGHQRAQSCAVRQTDRHTDTQTDGCLLTLNELMLQYLCFTVPGLKCINSFVILF